MSLRGGGGGGGCDTQPVRILSAKLHCRRGKMRKGGGGKWEGKIKKRKKRKGKEKKEKRGKREETEKGEGKKRKEKKGKEIKEKHERKTWKKRKKGKKKKERKWNKRNGELKERREREGKSMIEEGEGVRERVGFGGVVSSREQEKYASICCCVGSAVSVFSLDPRYRCRSLNYPVRCRSALFIYLVRLFSPVCNQSTLFGGTL